MLLGQQPCPDCEPAQVNHFVIRTSSYVGLAFKPLLHPFDYVVRVMLPSTSFSWFDKAGPLVLHTLAFFRLGKLQKEISPLDSDRTRALWEEARRQGITLVEYRFGVTRHSSREGEDREGEAGVVTNAHSDVSLFGRSW